MRSEVTELKRIVVTTKSKTEALATQVRVLFLHICWDTSLVDTSLVVHARPGWCPGSYS